jgi:hypothetical protein
MMSTTAGTGEKLAAQARAPAARKSALKPSLKDAARRARRLAVLLLGSTLIAAGLMLIPLPGPFTLALVFLGLTVLSWEFNRARTLLAKFKVKLNRLIGRRRHSATLGTHPEIPTLP